MPATTRIPLITLYGLLVLGVALRFVFLVTHPPLDHYIFDYDAISPIRDQWWLFHFYGAGFGFILGFGAFSVIVAILCLRRGAVLAALGGVVTTAGAILSALGFAAEGVAWAYATDPRVIDPVEGAKLLEKFGEYPAMIDEPILLGFLLVPIGVLIQLVALWVARAVPRWLLVATVVVLLLEVVPLGAPWFEATKAVLQAVALVAIGAGVLRRTPTAPLGAAA